MHTFCRGPTFCILKAIQTCLGEPQVMTSCCSIGWPSSADWHHALRRYSGQHRYRRPGVQLSPARPRRCYPAGGRHSCNTGKEDQSRCCLRVCCFLLVKVTGWRAPRRSAGECPAATYRSRYTWFHRDAASCQRGRKGRVLVHTCPTQAIHELRAKDALSTLGVFELALHGAR